MMLTGKKATLSPLNEVIIFRRYNSNNHCHKQIELFVKILLIYPHRLVYFSSQSTNNKIIFNEM